MTDRAAQAVAELKRESDAVLWSDPPGAMRMARAARDRGRASRDPLARALGEHALANSCFAAGRHGAAAGLYERASAGYRRLGRVRELAAVDLSRIGALLHLGRYPEAEAAGRAAKARFRALGDRRGEAKVLINLAGMRHAQDRHREAVALLERARTVFAASGDRAMVAKVDLDLANSLALVARFDRSGPLYSSARREAVALGLHSLVSRIDYNRAYDYFLQGRFHEARRLLRQVREAFRGHGQAHGLALAALDEAEIDLVLNRPEAAAEAAAEARDAFRASGSIVEAARAALFGAEAARRRGDEAGARALLEEARSGFLRARHRSGLASADLLAIGSSDLDAAERQRLAARAARTFAALGLPGRGAMAMVAGAGIALERGREARARELLASALGVARRRSLHDVEHRAEHTLARADAARGRPRRALSHYLRAVGAYERLRAGIRSDQDRLAFSADKSAVFEEAMRTALDLGRTETAFELLERTRARALVDLLAGDTRFVAAALGERLSRRWTRLRARLNRAESRERSSERRAGAVPAEVAAELRSLLAERDADLDRLAVESPDASYAVSGWPVASLECLRAVLGRERALIAYFGEGDCLGAAVVTEDGVRFRRGMARRAEVQRALAQLRFALATPRIDPERVRHHPRPHLEAAEAPLRELQRLLLEPIEPWFGDRAVVFVPDARLHLVPFHALSRKGTPLLAEREVTTAPSGTVLVRAMARRPATASALVLSVPDENAPAIAAEADAVARVLPGVRRLDAEQATVAAFLGEAPEARVLHLATHGVYEPAEPLLSGLRLHDGRLTLPEVSALGLDAQLVTLSACESAVGAPSGEEVLGLVRSFLQAGTRSLVAALWPVADASTAALMSGFYCRLVRGEGVGAALRAAALELRADLSHPYHWAPFVVVGDWGRLYSEGETAQRSPSR